MLTWIKLPPTVFVTFSVSIVKTLTFLLWSAVEAITLFAFWKVAPLQYHLALGDSLLHPPFHHPPVACVWFEKFQNLEILEVHHHLVLDFLWSVEKERDPLGFCQKRFLYFTFSLSLPSLQFFFTFFSFDFASSFLSALLLLFVFFFFSVVPSFALPFSFVLFLL